MLDAMNIEDIKKHLNQLNEFYQFLSEKGTEASRLEKDRFLAYISNLYDATWLVFKAEKKVTRTEPRLEEKMETRETITERSKAKLFFNPSTESDTSEEQSQKVTETSAIPKRSTSTATEPKEKAKLPEQKKAKLKTEEVKAKPIWNDAMLAYSWSRGQLAMNIGVTSPQFLHPGAINAQELYE